MSRKKYQIQAGEPVAETQTGKGKIDYGESPPKDPPPIEAEPGDDVERFFKTLRHLGRIRSQKLYGSKFHSFREWAIAASGSEKIGTWLDEIL